MEEEEGDGFFDNDWFDDYSDDDGDDSNSSNNDHLPDHMFSSYDQFYYDDEAGGRMGRRGRRSTHAPKCVACETRHKKERPTPEQFRKHLR